MLGSQEATPAEPPGVHTLLWMLHCLWCPLEGREFATPGGICNSQMVLSLLKTPEYCTLPCKTGYSNFSPSVAPLASTLGSLSGCYSVLRTGCPKFSFVSKGEIQVLVSCVFL